MTVLVESGVASIPGTESSSQGNYYVCNDAQVTLSITAAHGSLPRIDIVVINVRDQVYSGASNDSQLQVITGTAAASPTVPTAPANSITVVQIAVGAGVTSILNANITDTRYYLAATGGVINARTDATRPTSAEIAEGQLVWAMDNNRLSVWDGSAYNQLFPQGWTKIDEAILTGSAANITFGSLNQDYRALKVVIMARADTAATFTTLRFQLNSDASAIYDSQQVTGNAAAVAATETINATSGTVGDAAAASAPAGAAGGFELVFPFYTNTTFWKHFTSSNVLSTAAGTGGLHSKLWTGRWRNTAAITQIRFLITSNFVAGSSFVIYGLL